MGRLLVLVVLPAMLLVGPVVAADLTITSTLSEILQPDGTPFPTGSVPRLDELHGIPLLAKYDLSLEVADLAPGERGFGGVEFDVFFQSAQPDALLPVWGIPNPYIDSNGPAPGGFHLKWEDVIVNRIDVGNIDRVQAVAMVHWPRTFGPEGVDSRRVTGQNGAEHLASVYVPWDGSSVSQVKLRALRFSMYNEELLQELSQPTDERFDFLFGTTAPVFSVVEWNAIEWDDPLPAPTASRSTSVDGVGLTVTYEGTDHMPVSPSAWNSSNVPLFADFDDTSQTVTQEITFSDPVTDARFSIQGINAYRYSNSDLYEYVDQVQVVGLLDGTEVLPDLFLLADDAMIDGNTITALTVDDSTAWISGWVGVTFESAIDEIRITLGNASLARADPDRQSIAIGALQFSHGSGSQDPAVPEPSSAALGLLVAAMGCLSRIRRRTHS